MRAISTSVLLLLFMAASASGQSFVLEGSIGPTVTDRGDSVAGAIGFSPTSRLTVLFDVERTRLYSRFTSDDLGRVTSAFRGGTVTFAAAELRATLRGHDRVSPYVFGGYGIGISRPNVNERFPNGVTNNARVAFVGGGIQVPLRAGISVFGDIRMVIGAEGDDGILAFAPLRAGIAWRF